MSEENKTRLSPGIALEFSVFVCGALVMIYEIIGSRIVAPFIGTSTYVWTSLIGIILGALSLGYWLGGRTADRSPNVKVLASAIFIAGGLVSLTILTKDVVLPAIAAFPVGLELQSVMAALLLFAPASVALGFVIPYATKLRVASLDDTGKTVGRLYALSTIGSIVGTFAAGFLLIPFVGSLRTLYLVAAILFAISILLAGLSFTRFNFVLLTLFVFGIAASEIAAFYLWRTNNLFDIDTEYSRVRVFDTKDPRSGRMMTALTTDPYFVQSARFHDSDELALEYTRFYHLIRHYRPGFKRALMIGGAGYSFPQDYLNTYPSAELDVVEIDPKMTEIAIRHFGLRDDPRLNITHKDGRVFVNGAPAEKYDAILMDAFGSLFSVPYQLTTIEAVREMHRILNDDGVVIFNVGSAIRGPASRFLQAEFATYKAVFPAVHLYKVHPALSDSRLQNLIIVARKTKDPINEVGPGETDAFLQGLLDRRYLSAFTLDEAILTDDLAPVERFGSLALAYK
jgi:spermidine synthase